MNAAQCRRISTQCATFALALAMFGCAEKPDVFEVASRLADMHLGGLPAGQAPLARVRLQEETRWAVCLAPGTAFQVRLGASVEQIQLSVGLRSPQRGPVTFEVQEPGSPAVFAASLDGQTSNWRDLRVELGRSDVSRTLEFTTRSEVPAGSAPGGIAAACWGSVAFLRRSEATAPTPPNVILVSLDTLGAGYLAGFEHPHARSPRIDAFLADSYSFDRAFVQFGNTLVSHRSIFTSRYPSKQPRHGPQAESLAEALARHGYLTAAITENGYVGSAFGFARGFDRFVDVGGNIAASVRGNVSGIFERAVDWLERFGGDSRFFLFLHTYEVHEPYLPGDAESLALADAITPDDNRIFEKRTLARRIAWHNSGDHLLSERDIRRLSALYQGEVLYLDTAWGRLVDRLEALGLADDTLVVLTSDHGEAFGEQGKLGHGKTLHNRVLHVPLAFHWPRRIQPTRAPDVVQSVDIKPTVLGLAGLRVSGAPDGRDLSPLLLGDVTGLPPRAAFAEMNARAGDGTCRGSAYAVQTKRFKLVSCTDPPRERLVDLAADRDETGDAAAANPRELDRLRAMLADYRTRVGDRGAIDPEDGAANVDDATREQLRALGYLD